MHLMVVSLTTHPTSWHVRPPPSALAPRPPRSDPAQWGKACRCQGRAPGEVPVARSPVSEQPGQRGLGLVAQLAVWAEEAAGAGLLVTCDLLQASAGVGDPGGGRPGLRACFSGGRAFPWFGWACPSGPGVALLELVSRPVRKNVRSHQEKGAAPHRCHRRPRVASGPGFGRKPVASRAAGRAPLRVVIAEGESCDTCWATAHRQPFPPPWHPSHRGRACRGRDQNEPSDVCPALGSPRPGVQTGKPPPLADECTDLGTKGWTSSGWDCMWGTPFYQSPRRIKL